ncbi:MAG: LLM class flavin-dependent oxidoreductase [Actinobacteria bacterium]|nr:LLM class flavin-dependent oxidoreductase [Actinomycetota bacterium]
MEVSYWASSTQSFDDIRLAAQWAAEAGWRGAWLPDHFMMSADNDNGPGPTEAEMNPMLEGWVTLGALAASVPDLRLGLMVGGNTYRHPGVVANMALTLDHISGGRAVLGLGAGWQINEHVAYGIELEAPKPRVDRFEEAIHIIRSLLNEPRTTFEGSGAGHRRTLRTVARSADEWNAWGRPDTIAGHLEVLRGHCEAEGRSFDDLHLTAVGLLILVDDTETSATLRESLAHRSGLIGTVDELKAVIEEYRAVGVDELIVPDFAIVGPGKLDVLQRFQDEVLA